MMRTVICSSLVESNWSFCQWRLSFQVFQRGFITSSHIIFCSSRYVHPLIRSAPLQFLAKNLQIIRQIPMRSCCSIAHLMDGAWVSTVRSVLLAKYLVRTMHMTFMIWRRILLLRPFFQRYLIISSSRFFFISQYQLSHPWLYILGTNWCSWKGLAYTL